MPVRTSALPTVLAGSGRALKTLQQQQQRSTQLYREPAKEVKVAYKTTDLERSWRRCGWYLITRSSDTGYLEKRAAEMRLQGWQAAAIPYSRRVYTLFSAPEGTVKP